MEKERRDKKCREKKKVYVSKMKRDLSKWDEGKCHSMDGNEQ